MMRKATLLATVAVLGLSGPLSAATAPAARNGAAPAPADQPIGGAAADLFGQHSDSMPPILRWLQTNGVKITSMTPASGNGSPGAYLLESGDGKMQTGYLQADGTMVYGIEVRLSPDGSGLQNVTNLQVLDLKQRYNDQQRQVDEQKRAAAEAQRRADAAAAALSDQQRQFGEIARQLPEPPQAFVKGTPPATPAVPMPAPVPAPAAPPVQAPSSPVPVPSIAPAAAPAPAATSTTPPGTPAAQATPLTLPGTPAAAGAAMARFASPLDKARFLHDVEGDASQNNGVPYFRVGAESSPTLYMVVDPQCPHCHAAWHQLLPLIAAGTIKVDVIMIAGLPGSEPLAISILSHPNPGQVFLGAGPAYQGEGSTEGVTVSPPPPVGSPAYRQAQGYLDANMDFARKENVTGTPWMAYVGKDGRLYQYAGDNDLTAFLAGL